MGLLTLSARRATMLRRIRRRAWLLIAVGLLWQAGAALLSPSAIDANPAFAQPTPQEHLP